jgi:nucleotide-binding universal stress UspA family protein
MIRTILVPLDGSQTAENALPWARSLARRSGAAIKLARVRLIPSAPVTSEGMSADNSDVFEYTRDEENSYMTQIVSAWIDSDAQTSLTGELIEGNDTIAGTLIDFAESNHADLTIMTTHGHGPVSRFLFGSVSDEYLRRASGPTLMVRADASITPLTSIEPHIRNVIVPLDGSLLSEQAVSPAIALFDWFGCEITLLLVLDAVGNINHLMESIEGAVSNKLAPKSATPIAEEYLRRVADRLRKDASRVTIRVVEHGSAAETILAHATTPETAIAISTHGQSGLTRMMFGSVADKVVRGAVGPVLAVRPKSV